MVIEYDFNQFDEVSEERWFNPGETEPERTIVFEYDRYGRLTHVDDADTDYTYEYDEFGRLRVETVTTDDSVTSFVYRYDDRSRIESVTAFIDGQEDFTNSYLYNASGMVRELTQTGPDVISKRVVFDYDVLNHTVTQSRYEGENLVVESTYNYATASSGGRGSRRAVTLTGIEHVDAYGQVLASHSYTYNDAGLVETYTNDTDSVDYSYDPTGQLIDADYQVQDDEAFEYDANGNQLQFTIGANNQILCDGVYFYEYDAEGSRTEKYQWTDTDGDSVHDADEKFDLTTYSWDARGRLIKITTLPDGSEATKTVKYSYDYLNRRTDKQIKETNSEGKKVKSKESYTYLGHDIVLQQNDGQQSHRYLHHPDVVDQCLADESLFDHNGDEDANVLYPLFDNLNSVRDIADYDPILDETDIVNSLAYSASGAIVAETDPTVKHIYGHAGQEIDRESGLLKRGVRYTDPILNVFTSTDPIGFFAHDTNLYRYVHNDPVNFTDPTGLWDGDRIEVVIHTDENGDSVAYVYYVDVRTYVCYYASLFGAFSSEEQEPRIIGVLDDSGFVRMINSGKWTDLETISKEAREWTSWDHFESTFKCKGARPDLIKDGNGLISWRNRSAEQIGDETIFQKVSPESYADVIDGLDEGSQLVGELLIFYGTAPAELAFSAKAFRSLGYADSVTYTQTLKKGPGLIPLSKIQTASHTQLRFLANRVKAMNDAGTLSNNMMPKLISVAIDQRTGKVYYGLSLQNMASRRPTRIAEALNARVTALGDTQHSWEIWNCAEFNSLNHALLDGARYDDLFITTVNYKTLQRVPRCDNCFVTTDGTTVLSELFKKWDEIAKAFN